MDDSVSYLPALLDVLQPTEILFDSMQEQKLPLRYSLLENSVVSACSYAICN
jgi:hypothetical protein